MLDFVEFRFKESKKGCIDIYPEFINTRTDDLMIRGHDFYALWDEDNETWTRDEFRVQEIIDHDLREYANSQVYGLENYKEINIKFLKNFSSRKWEEFQRFCKNMPDNYHDLDDDICFKGDKLKREDYKSKHLTYDMMDGDISAYTELTTTLYSPEERMKFEWAIGSVLAGEGKNIQKFIVFYGSAGTGKSTILNIIQKIFDGYYVIFDSKSLVSNKDFALEQFKSNPLVAIQHDGDLSKVEDNSKLNSLVSHEYMIVNEKYKAPYSARSNAFLFMGTNRPVQITEAKSGLIRRLIDVSPTGYIIPQKQYEQLLGQIDFEIPCIAKHCYDVYKSLGPKYYSGYKPEVMVGATNDFYNYIEDNWDFFTTEKYVTLSEAWKRYKLYCDDANIGYPMRKMMFKNELKNYFMAFRERTANNTNIYIGFIKDKFKFKQYDPSMEMEWLIMDQDKSILDDMLKDCKAQYTNKAGTPKKKWDRVKTTLADIDTKELHYIQPPKNHIVIDFDFKTENGEKDPIKNVEEANKWPKTYGEFSRNGGVHLHYIYDGDVEMLANRINADIEIKKFVGNAALRRQLSKCNNLPILTINSGLPLKEGGAKVIDFKGFTNEKALYSFILKCLRKEHHQATKPEVDFIFKALEDAYNSGMSYDLSALRPKVLSFAFSSTHQSDYCTKLVAKMKFTSKDFEAPSIEDSPEKPIVFYDVEVFPNLFLVNWKFAGSEHKVVRMINPTSEEIEKLVTNNRLIGFNCRRYDNHILYGKMLGYNNAEIYDLSQKIISGSQNGFFGEAWNLSYTDVYDFASNPNKMSLKKWEIKLCLHHQELGLPWDKPVPKELWNKVAEYCDNDVISTEAVFDHIQGDFVARQILAVLSGLSVNDTTNSHSKRIIFQGNRHPQDEFVYTDLSTIFPGYKFDNGVSTYAGETVGEGGYVWAAPGMYANVTTFDVASMHPSSIEQLNLFGDRYTKRFSDIKQARVFIKRGEFDKLNDILDGKLIPFVQAIQNGTATYSAKDLSNALKTVINSVYGLSTAHFDNEFKDPRNIDNIVAKRGALFMITLKNECIKRGIKAIHVKTDSIKVVEPTEEDKEFILNFGKEYGYEFEIESVYERICLVNDAVYIANEVKEGWTAVGKEFAEPYIFKTLFSHEDLEYEDYWQTKESKKGDIFLDMNEDMLEGDHDYKFIGKTGAFVPIKEGCGGGLLLAKRDEDKYVAVTGTKGYRWLDVEMVKLLHKQDDIDLNYYSKMVDEAKEHIAEFGNVDKFLDLSIIFVNNFLDIAGDNNVIPYFQTEIAKGGKDNEKCA